MGTAKIAVGGAAGGVGAVAVLLATLMGATPTRPAAAAGQLAPGLVPAAFEPWVLRAGALCPQISAPLIAAQLEAESGFNPRAVSPAGAQGPAQFMPGTWPSWGRDDDANGTSSPFDIGDAVMAQGRFDCALAAQMQQALTTGRVGGDVTDLTLAAYNAGAGAVVAARGVPQNGETPAYVARIRSSMAKYTQVGPGAVGVGVVPGAPFAQNVVAAASRWIGTTYAWGGGDVNGPTRGIRDGGVADRFGDYNKVGFDCSGLVIYAVYQASSGTVTLPHSAAAQARMGVGVPVSAIQPGDVLFFGAPVHHTGIYIGGGQMVNAPQSGETVKISNLSGWAGEAMSARRFG